MSTKPSIPDILSAAGLDDLPEAALTELGNDLQTLLACRVGDRLSQGLTGDQIDDFERLIAGDLDLAQIWLEACPMGEKILNEITAAIPDLDRAIAEAGSLAWMKQNVPHYKDVVEDEMAQLERFVHDHTDDLRRRVTTQPA